MQLLNLGDVIVRLYEAIKARKVIHIDMTLGNDRYIFNGAPEGTPMPQVINIGTYFPSLGDNPSTLDMLTRKQIDELNELLARLGYSTTVEDLIRDEKWVVHLLENGTTIFESPRKGGAGFEQPKGQDGWLTRARGD